MDLICWYYKEGQGHPQNRCVQFRFLQASLADALQNQSARLSDAGRTEFASAKNARTGRRPTVLEEGDDETTRERCTGGRSF